MTRRFYWRSYRTYYSSAFDHLPRLRTRMWTIYMNVLCNYGQPVITSPYGTNGFYSQYVYVYAKTMLMYWFSDLIQVYPAACIKRRTHVREVFERSGIETGFCSLQAAPYAPFPFGRYTRIMDLRIISDWKMITKFRGEAFTWGLILAFLWKFLWSLC